MLALVFPFLGPNADLAAIRAKFPAAHR